MSIQANFSQPVFDKVLIANRGEIACRVIRSLKKMGIKSVAIYSEADKHALHVLQADEAYCVGPAAASESYLNTSAILAVAKQTGAQAIHPGYGFLSENAAFSQLCEENNIRFIGPTPEQMKRFGLKHTAREIAAASKTPLLPGTGLLNTVEEAITAAGTIGFPIMVKSTAGGGGIGMQLCRDISQLAQAFESVQRLSKNNFKDSGIYLEKFVENARHIEVQIFGDGNGHVVHLGERDCSVQRRNQKVIEETPAPNLANETRIALWETAVSLAKQVNYRSAGTVEFVFDADTEQFYFLEVNTRLQVEHGVTELVTGADLVEWMIRLAAGDNSFLAEYKHKPEGAAIQVRIYAEDPNKDFQPSSGLITAASYPENVRVDGWLEAGTMVSSYYDPLLAKIMSYASTRTEAINLLVEALEKTTIAGIETNKNYTRAILQHPIFVSGKQVTRFLNQFNYQPNSIDIIDGGVHTSIQDYPGRLGYWAVGIPPSGPMDSLAFRLGNRMLGNNVEAAGLECAVSGPTLKFNITTEFVITGAKMAASLNGKNIENWQVYTADAGAILELGGIESAGARTYILVKGGFDVPNYLGAKSTFTLGQFGGHGGRALRIGDVMHLNPNNLPSSIKALPAACIPIYSKSWKIHVMYGPHGAPDFFTEKDIKTFFATEWEIHYNSSRTGIRLIGPKPEWARTDGGEAGLHPSNIHDNAYAIGTVDFTGDMPVILGPDGPSLGGFVCPVTTIQADLWKLGQLKPSDKVKFIPVSAEKAEQIRLTLEKWIEAPTEFDASNYDAEAESITSPILAQGATKDGIAINYRQAGDAYLLVEYGPLALDLTLRFRAHALMHYLEANPINGTLDLTPGIRSLQIHFDPAKTNLNTILAQLKLAEENLPNIEDIEIPSRIVHLPLSWDDPSTQLAIQKYMQSVRGDAPWCPSNIEFIKRINGLKAIEEVKNVLFDASYLVMGLGDVYLGAPVATPLDPRHRLVTTKYNPARTWTPENAVGIGGAYLCVYGMEGPGGYQFVGRTVQMWNRYKTVGSFQNGLPWLLRFFDQIRFYLVDQSELAAMREDFLHGKFEVKIEPTHFKLRDYLQFLEANSDSIQAFKAIQQTAFEEERERWRIAGHNETNMEPMAEASNEEIIAPEGCKLIRSHVSGSVWEIKTNEGQTITAEIGRAHV